MTSFLSAHWIIATVLGVVGAVLALTAVVLLSERFGFIVDEYPAVDEVQAAKIRARCERNRRRHRTEHIA